MEQMYKICDRLIWIEDGAIREEGTPKFIGEAYLAAMEGRRLDRIEFEEQQKKAELEERIREEQERLRKEQEGHQEAERAQEALEELRRKQEALQCNESLKGICPFYRSGARRQTGFLLAYTNVTMCDQDGRETNRWETGRDYKIRLAYKAADSYEGIRFVIGVTRDDGVYCYGSYKEIPGLLPRQGMLEFSFRNGLLKGKYVLDLWIEDFSGAPFDSIYSLAAIEVETDPYIERGILTMEHEWKVC